MYGGGINMLRQQPYSDVGTMIQDRMDNGVIVTLRGTDNKAQFSIPQLQKQFATAGVGDEVQFIVKSFSFHTEFVNLKRGDGFNFWLPYISIQYRNDLINSATQEWNFDRSEPPFAIPLIFDSDFDEVHVTTDEFVNILNSSKLFALREFAIEYPQNIVIQAPQLMPFEIFNVLQHSEFVYDYTVGKIGLRVDLQGRSPQLYYDNLSNELHSIRVFKLLMQPFDSLSALNQYRLAQLMGFGANIDTTIGSQAGSLYEYTYFSPLMETYLFHPIGVNLVFYPPNSQQAITLFSPYVSDNLPNKFVIIRSSARSNVVSDKGKREGILLSIAVTQSSIETYQTFNEDRLDFASKDTLQGVKAMSIDFVDEFNQPLTFRTPYELKVGIYFK